MIVKMFTVGLLDTNCYVVECEKTGEAVIIDPGFGSTKSEHILSEVSRIGFEIRYLVNTHGHVDHTSGNRLVKEKTGAPILIHRDDEAMLTDPQMNLSREFGIVITPPPADRLLQEGDIIKVGQLNFRVIHTPGHTRGSISILGEDIVFTGDTLFAGSIGRTDFPGSSFEMIMQSIRERLMRLPDHVRVYPGHGPLSTIGDQRKNNLFLRGLY